MLVSLRARHATVERQLGDAGTELATLRAIRSQVRAARGAIDYALNQRVFHSPRPPHPQPHAQLEASQTAIARSLPRAEAAAIAAAAVAVADGDAGEGGGDGEAGGSGTGEDAAAALCTRAAKTALAHGEEVGSWANDAALNAVALLLATSLLAVAGWLCRHRSLRHGAPRGA